MMKYLMPFLIVVGLVCCSSNNPKPEHESMMPVVPESITDPAARLEYAVLHFWEKFDFAQPVDTALTEQHFVDFAYILPYCHNDNAIDSAVGALVYNASAQEPNLRLLSSLAEKYLYDAESPMHNEELYLPFATLLVKQAAFSSAEKERIKYQIQVSNMNRPGSDANDFMLTMPDGRPSSLAAQAAGERATLLFFFDPECDNCHSTMQTLASNAGLKVAVDNGAVKVLAVFAGENADLWPSCAANMPVWWTVAADATDVDGSDLYSLRAMPVLYMLSPGMKVYAKDLNPALLDDVLAGLNR